MSFEGFTAHLDTLAHPVVRARDMRVSVGANVGDPVATADEMALDDIFRLRPETPVCHLALDTASGPDAPLRVASASQIGRSGAEVHVDCRLTFMAPDGITVEALVLVELERGSDLIADTYLLPMADLRPRTDYALIDLSRRDLSVPLAETACVSFVRGTRITLADGTRVPVEDLRPGARILTRDRGARVVRWTGTRTARAIGRFAPITFAPGSVNNDRALRVSPNQRLFFYQRGPRGGTGRAAVVVRAEDLVNGDTITRCEGGFVDYVRILLDGSAFIYAEGVATETLTCDSRTAPALPAEIRDAVQGASAPAP